MRHKSVPTPTIEIAILAKTLLNSGEYEPQWTTLSKTIKRALCVETNISFSQIHRESFYKELHKIWTDNKKERDRIQACPGPLARNRKCSVFLYRYRMCYMYRHIQTRW